MKRDLENHVDYIALSDLLDELKSNLYSCLDEQAREEIEYLRAINAKLLKRVADLEQKLTQLTQEKDKQLAQTPLATILGQREVILYCPKSSPRLLPKCPNCDENRTLVFASPQGRLYTENCKCAQVIGREYKPVEWRLYEMQKRGKRVLTWFTAKDDPNGVSGARHVTDDNIYHGQPYDMLNVYNIYFNNEAECQLYCDWLNNNPESVFNDMIE